MGKKDKLQKKGKEDNKIALFEGEEIRRVMFDGDWFYSIEDVVAVVSGSSNPKNYVKDLRRRDEELSKGWGQIATPLPIMTKGGRQNINCANTESVLRIIQSIPSKNAEPFKRWLARVGKERLDEIEQPEKAIERAKGYYMAKGYSQQWIETRSASVDTRHKFTDTLKEHGINEGYEYAVLTNELYNSSFGFSSSEYKEHKGISKGESLRDHMTPLELASVIFSEATSTELINETDAEGFIETKKAIHIAGNITKEAIEKLERETGKKVVTHENAKALDSIEVRNELIRKSLPAWNEIEEDEEPLSDFNKNLKKGLGFNPKEDVPKEKRTSAYSLKALRDRKKDNEGN
ncbi:Bro-N domain-containing protein [uncultured Dokdonia sp.]|uniref:BRO-N domain-containing protein n=1 Tax=uncultured Dokdonia sp. TaxID=575653 RepID=UPI00261B27F5|nr:Bro-N domain-containing protein [uncultured Dokdonia sp.]